MNKHVRVWSLQDAKARFSEVVRLAQSEGPQLVTIHGKEAVTITAATEPSRRPAKTGKDLVEALRQGPPFDLKIPPRPKHAKFRKIEL